MDKTGARAIEEQIIFAAIWAGATFKEAYDRISFEADTTYLGAEFQISSVVSFMQANKDARFLSKQNAYSVLERTFPGVISNFQDNEAQLEEDSADEYAKSQAAMAQAFEAFNSRLKGADDGENEDAEGDEGEEEKTRDDDEDEEGNDQGVGKGRGGD